MGSRIGLPRGRGTVRGAPAARTAFVLHRRRGRAAKLSSMYVSQEVIAALERRFGAPETHAVESEFAAREVELLDYCRRKGRAHDVTLLIHPPGELGQFAVIRKPSYPPGLFRPPSGGVEEAEDFETGAAREALEETGLAVTLERYLLRVDARFRCDGRVWPWTTHVFSAVTEETEVAPRDLKEIEEARWAAVEEILSSFRPAMLKVGSAGMRYRVFLQDRALLRLGLEIPEGEVLP